MKSAEAGAMCLQKSQLHLEQDAFFYIIGVGVCAFQLLTLVLDVLRSSRCSRKKRDIRPT